MIEEHLHADGDRVVIDFSQPFFRNMSREAVIWWMTQTRRRGQEAEEDVKIVLARPAHPSFQHAVEVMAAYVRERLTE